MAADKFPKTSLSGILRAQHDTPEGRAAFAVFCKAYWYPVYVFIRRRVGSADKAHDSTQGVFTSLVEKNDFESFDRTRGTRFRAWLLGRVKHFLANERRRDEIEPVNRVDDSNNADAGAAEVRYLAERSHDFTPDRQFDHAFAMNVLERVIERLHARYAAAGQTKRFNALKGNLTQHAVQRTDKDVAVELNMSLDAVRKAAFDLRRLFKEELKKEVARLVDGPNDPNDPSTKALVLAEVRELLAALSA